jgi:surface antigen
MLKALRTTAIAAAAVAFIGAAAPADADGYRNGPRHGRTVHVTKHVTKKVIVVHRNRWRKAPPPRRYRRPVVVEHRHYYRPRPVKRIIHQRVIHVAPRPAAYAYGDRTVAGGLIGAVIGGLTGSQIGKGSGRTAAILGGTVIGAIVGGNIGQAMDRTDYLHTQGALETARAGAPVTWVNPDTGNNYSVTPTRTYQTETGQYCREFTTWGWIGGHEERLYGTACRMPDGSWKKTG